MTTRSLFQRLSQVLGKNTHRSRSTRRRQGGQAAVVGQMELLERRELLSATAPFDIDGDGTINPSVDGLLLYLSMSPTPDDTLEQFILPTAADDRNTPDEIRQHVTDVNGDDNALDLDGSGDINPSVDGLLAYLLMSPTPDDTLEQFILPNAASDRNTPAKLRQYAQSMLEVPADNLPPTILDQPFTVPENSLANMAVGQVVATDPNNGQALTYAITAGNTGNAFQIDAATGQITVADPASLDFEVTPVFELTVQVTDNGSPAMSASATVTVNLTNDFEVTQSGFQAIVPLYQYPLSDPTTINAWWQQIIDQASAAHPVTVIVNPSNGPLDPESGVLQYDQYITGLTALRTNPNIRIAAYIRTNRGNTPAAQVAEHLSWYESGYKHPSTGASLIDGIFLDEMATDPAVVAYYETVAESVRASKGLAGTLLIGNPGAPSAVEYLDKGTADFFIIREETFANLDAASLPAYVTDPAYDHLKFGAISHTTPSAEDMREALRQMKLAGLDFGFVTDDVNTDGDPFNATPSFFAEYLQQIHAPYLADALLSLPENSANGTVVGSVNGFDPDLGQTLTYAITAGNTNNAFTINAANGQITVADTTALDFESTPTFNLTVSIADNSAPALSSTAAVTVNLTNVNEAPTVVSQPGVVQLTNGNPERTIDLNTVFGDADGDALTYRIVSSTAGDNFTVQLQGSSLSLASIADKTGNGSVVIEARDDGGATIVTLIDVEVDRTSIEVVQYALTQDVLMQSQGSVVVDLHSNLNATNQITVESADPTTIHPDDVELFSLGGGQIRVLIRHRTDDYGITLLRLRSTGQPLSEFAVMVTPPADRLLENTGVPTLTGMTSADGEGTSEQTRTVNSRWLANSVATGQLDFHAAMSIIRVANPLAAAVYLVRDSALMTYEAKVQFVAQTSSQRNSSNAPLPQKNFQTLLGKSCEIINGKAKCYVGLSESSKDPLAFVREKAAATDWEGAAKDLISTYDEPSEWASLDPVEVGLEITRAYVKNTDFTQFFENAENKKIQLITDVAINTFELLDPARLAKILKDPSVLADLMENIEDVAELGGVLDDVDPRFRAAWESAQGALEVTNFIKDIEDILHDFPDGVLDQLNEARKLVKKTFDTLEYLTDQYKEITKHVPEIEKFFERFTLPLRGYYESGRTILEGKVEDIAKFAVPDSLKEKLDENGHSLFGKDTIGVIQDAYGIAKLGVSIFDTLGDIFNSADDDPNRVREIRKADSSEDLSIHTGGGNDIIRTGSGNDSIVSGNGDDNIRGGDGRNEVVSGNGDDVIHDGKDGSLITAGPGDDHIYDLGGGDLLDGGLGLDTYVYESRETGNDRIVDPSRAGNVLLNAYPFNELTVRKDRYDLEILMPSIAGRTENSIRFSDYFKVDRSDWVIRDQSGAQLSLDLLVGRFDYRSALQIATVSEPLTDVQSVLPLNTTHLVRHDVTTQSGSTYHVDLFSDQRASQAGRNTLGIIIHGDRSIDGFFSRHHLGGLADADEILTAISLPSGSISDFKNVSVFGTGSAGVMAQWVASGLSTSIGNSQFDAVANVYAVNAPDLSGLIQEVLSTVRPEYSLGMPKLNTTLMHHADDWASRISVWAGNEQSYGTWVRWQETGSERLAVHETISIENVRKSHGFSHDQFDFTTLQYEILGADEVLAHVRLHDISDSGLATASELVDVNGESVAKTVSWMDVMINQSVNNPLGDTPTEIEEFWKSSQLDVVQYFAASPHAAPSTIWAFDFGPDTTVAPVELNFIEINPDKRYGGGTASDTTSFGFTPQSQGLGAQYRGKASATNSDFVTFGDATFIVDVAPGMYDIALTLGDRQAIREDMAVEINGYATDVVSTMPGAFLTRRYRVDTTDGNLRFRLQDLGGRSDAATALRGAITSLVITPADFRGELLQSEANDKDAPLVVLTHGYDMTSVDLEGLSDAIRDLVIDVALTVATGGAALPKLALSLASHSMNIATNFTSNPRAKGILSATGSILSLTNDTFVSPKKSFSELSTLKKVTKGAKFLDKGLKTLKTALDTSDGSVRDGSRVHDWVFDAAVKYAEQAENFSLEQLDPSVIPVDFEDVDKIIQAAKDNSWEMERLNRNLLNLWEGSRDFIALDWADISNDGIGLFGSDEAIYRNSVNRAARAYKKLIEARIAELKESDPDAKLDILLVGHGTGYNVNRELVERLNESDTASDLDYVKFVSLNPISTNRDELAETEFQSDKYYWYHPEMTTILSSVDNYYRDAPIYETNEFGSAVGGGALGGVFGLVSRLVEDRINEELIFGDPLDGRVGGSKAGFYNRTARLFQFTEGSDVELGVGEVPGVEEILRYRHWDPNTARLEAGELVDIQFSPDGKRIATSSRDGSVTVRTVDAVEEIRDEQGDLLQPALAPGSVLYNVYQHGPDYSNVSPVNSVRFSSDSSRLLTVANDVGTILVTDAESGRPLWRGGDTNVLRADFSPTANTIVSVDTVGNGLVWLRNEETDAYARLTESAVPLHGEAILDLVVINDSTFVTGSTNKRLKLWEIGGDGRIRERDVELFGGSVRNLSYDPVSGLLAVGAGQQTYLYEGATTGFFTQVWHSPDHVGAVQGLSFNSPVRTVVESDGSSPYQGLLLYSGGEDRTVFRLDLSRFNERIVQRTGVISGAMLPIREISTNPAGDIIAVVGQDNVNGESGGPVKDIDVTAATDARAGLYWDRLFVDGQRQHNAVPYEYLETYVDGFGESFFWERISDASGRPGAIDPAANLSLPPFKRGANDQASIDPINLYVRPGDTIEFLPKRYLVDADRDDFSITDFGQPQPGEGTLVRPNGRPNTLRYSAPNSLPGGETILVQLAIELTGLPKTDGELPDVRESIFTVHVVNEAPVANDNTARTYPGGTVEIAVRSNDYDFEDDPLSDVILMDTIGEYGFLNRKSSKPNVLVYVVNPSVDITNGDLVDSFTYAIQDSFGATSTATITVTIGDYEGPGNVVVDELGADQLLLRWEEVRWTSKYEIRLDNGHPDPAMWDLIDTVTGGKLHYRVKDLASGANYRFAVVAVNDTRQRAGTPVEETTPPYEPVVVEKIDLTPRTSQIDVRWDPVYWDVAKYRIELGSLVDGEFVIAPDVPAKERKVDENRIVTFKSLVPDRIYAARVVAIGNAKSTGGVREVPSVAKLTRTLKRAAVESVLLRRVGPDGVQVDWTSPNWDVGSVDRFRVIVADTSGREILNADGTPKFRVGNLASTKRTETIYGLDVVPDFLDEYLIYVEARDANGHWISPHPGTESNVSAITRSTVLGLDDLDTTLLLNYDSTDDQTPMTLTLPPLDSTVPGASIDIFNASDAQVHVYTSAGDPLRFDGIETSFASLAGLAEIAADGNANASDELKRTVTYTIYREADFWRVIRTGAAVFAKLDDVWPADLREGKAPTLRSYPFGVQLDWERPFWNVNSYTLKLFSVDPATDNESFVRSESVNDTNSPKYSYRFQGLDAGGLYRVEMEATGVVNGATVTSRPYNALEPKYATGQLAPTLNTIEVEDVISSTSIVLQWKYPLFDASGNPIQDETGEQVFIDDPADLNLEKLVIRYKTDANSNYRDLTNDNLFGGLTADATEATLINLNPARRYTFIVRAEYPGGNKASNYVTAPVLPEPVAVNPESISPTYVSRARIDIQWQGVPYDVKNYAVWVEASDGGQPDGRRRKEANVSGTLADGSDRFEHIFTDLDQETTYFVFIAPRNSIAQIDEDTVDSSQSHSDAITTLGRTPVEQIKVTSGDEYGEFAAEINNARLLKVSWQHQTVDSDIASLNSNEPINFVVQKSRANANDWDDAAVVPAQMKRVDPTTGLAIYEVLIGPDPANNDRERHFTKLHPGETYQIRVKIEYRLDTVTTLWQGTETIKPPLPVKVDEQPGFVYPTQAKLVWRQVTGVTVDHYQIQAYDTQTDTPIFPTPIQVNTGTGPRDHVVENLPQGRSLYFRVTANGEMNNGQRFTSVSDQLHVTMPERKKPVIGDALGIKFYDVRATKLNIRWTYPDPHSTVESIIERFEIYRLRENGTPEKIAQQPAETNDAGNYYSKEITRGPNAAWQVFVRPVFKDGGTVDKNGGSIDSEIAPLPLPPTGPATLLQPQEDDVKATELTLRWTHEGGDPSGFHILKKNPAGGYDLAKVVAGSVFKETVTNADTKLIPGVDYEFTIKTIYQGADNVDGANALSVTMGSASSPQGLKQSGLQSTSVTVAWTKPDWDVADYFVKLTKPNGSVVNDTVGKNETTATFNNLGRGESYTVEVRARNKDIDAELIRTATTTAATAPFVTPINVIATEATQNTMLVSWSFEDPLGGWDEFIIQSTTDNGVTWANVFNPSAGSVDKSNRSKVVTDLSPGQAYRFRVKVNYPGDNSRTSEPSPQVSTLAPQFGTITASVDGKRRITVQWPATPWEPKSLQIQVRIVDANSQPLSGWTVPNGGNITNDLTRTSKEISELLPGTRYEIRLIGLTKQNESVTSGSIYRTTEAFPPISELSSADEKPTSAVLSWRRLETLDNDANVSKYRVEIFRNGVFVKFDETANGGSGGRHSKEIIGLEPGTNYQFKVIAYNGSIKLSESGLSAFATTSLGVVSGAKVLWTTPTSVRVEWNQLSGYGVTEYLLRIYNAATGAEVGTPKDAGLGSGKRQSEVNGLPQGGSYQFQVDAMNGSELVGQSAKVSFTTANGAAVSSLVATDRQKKGFTLNWVFGGDVHGLKEIRIIRQNANSQGKLGTKTNFDNMAYTLTGLNKNTQYTVFLRIEFKDGSIAESDFITVMTLN